MDEEATGGLDALNGGAGEGDLDALTLANMTPENFLSRMAGLQARIGKVPPGMSAADYSEAEAKIKARRYGPSRTEQLFQLASAIGKPTLTRSFGAIMGNIAPALADATKANREAEMARQDALDALKRQYLLEGRQGELAKIAAEQKVLSTAAPLIAASMKPKGRKTWDSASQRFVTEDNPLPTKITGVINGQKVTQYTDSTLRLTRPDGSQLIYSASGDLIGTAPSTGAR